MNFLQNLDKSAPTKVGLNWIWTLDVPPKVGFFLWKVCVDGLSTKSQLEKSHVFMPKDCVFYGNHSEDTHHLLFDCNLTHDVFFQLSQSGDWPTIIVVDPREGIDMIFSSICDGIKFGSFVKLACV